MEDDLLFNLITMPTLLALALKSQAENVLPIEYALLPFAPEMPGNVEPPPANRGLIPHDLRNDLEIGIDYLTVVLTNCSWDDIQYLKGEAEEHGKTVFVDKPGIGTKHGTYFSSHMRCPLGSKIPYQPNKTHPWRYDAIIVLGGKVCGRMGTSQCAGFVREVIKLGGHVCRIDIKTDDYLRQLNYLNVSKLADDECFTTFQEANLISNIKRGKGRTGSTVVFGKRTGEKLIRVYDAKPVHGIDATRFEGEYKGEYAKMIGNEIATITDDGTLTRFLGGILNGTFRLTEKKDRHNASRVKSAPCWKQFSDRLGDCLKLTRPRVTVLLQNKFAFLRDKCSKTLAMFRAYSGVHFAEQLNDIIRAGFARLNAEDLAMLAASSKEAITRIYCDNNDVCDIVHNPVWYRDWMEPDVVISEGYDCPF